MHSGTDINSCEQCHEGHNSGHDNLLKDEVSDLCVKCHKNLGTKLERKKKHTILEEEDCIVCHIPHYKKGTSHLESQQPDLCFNCHSEIEEKLELEYVHAVVIDDDCTTCHDPHAGVLNDPESEVCSGCHDIEDDEFTDKHANIIPAKCSTCHDPHGSENEYIIMTNYHPPFEEGDCESCHEDGQSFNELRDNELCLNCHDPEPVNQHSEDSLSENKCVDCHSPHASNDKYLRIKSYLSD